MSVHAAEALAGLFAGFSGAHIRFRPEGVDHRGKRKENMSLSIPRQA